MPKQHPKKLLKRLIISTILITFGWNSILPGISFAQVFPSNLPQPGNMVNLSSNFVPPLFRGIKVDLQNPLNLNFILDTGNAKLAAEDLKTESNKLIKYFLASLTTPEKDIWVNLSPYEKDRIVPEAFGQTDMGKDLLSQDYLLKQLTASLIYPENDLGKKFWDKIYNQAQEKFGTTDIPVNTFNKVWIIPGHATVYENDGAAFIGESKLKVMLEEDYQALKNNAEVSSKEKSMTNEIVRQIILPAIEKEVNEGENFANLRQIYHALILAAWFKRSLKESLLGQKYANQNKVKGIDLEDKNIKQEIYDQYLEAFKKGVYDFTKEEFDPTTQEIIQRKYFSGGFMGGDMAQKNSTTLNILPLTGDIHPENTIIGQSLIAEFRLDNPADSAALTKKQQLKKYTDRLSILTERLSKLPKKNRELVIPEKLQDETLEIIGAMGKLYGHDEIAKDDILMQQYISSLINLVFSLPQNGQITGKRPEEDTDIFEKAHSLLNDIHTSITIILRIAENQYKEFPPGYSKKRELIFDNLIKKAIYKKSVAVLTEQEFFLLEKGYPVILNRKLRNIEDLTSLQKRFPFQELHFSILTSDTGSSIILNVGSEDTSEAPLKLIINRLSNFVDGHTHANEIRVSPSEEDTEMAEDLDAEKNQQAFVLSFPFENEVHVARWVIEKKEWMIEEDQETVKKYLASVGLIKTPDAADLTKVRSREGFGFAKGSLWGQEELYRQALVPLFINSKLSENEQKEVISALIRIRKESLNERTEFFDDTNISLILDFQPFDINNLVERLIEEKGKYQNAKDRKGKKLFTSEKIHEFLFKKFISLRMINELMQDDLTLGQTLTLFRTETDPKGTWKIRKATRDAIMKDGLTKTEATYLALRWKDGLKKWKRVRPAWKRLKADGLNHTEATRAVSMWTNPETQWDIRKPIRDELVKDGLTISQANYIVLAWHDPEGEWAKRKLVRDDMVKDGLILFNATFLSCRWANPREKWQAVKETTAGFAKALGIDEAHAQEILRERKYNFIFDLLERTGLSPKEIQTTLAPLTKYEKKYGRLDSKSARIFSEKKIVRQVSLRQGVAAEKPNPDEQSPAEKKYRKLLDVIDEVHSLTHKLRTAAEESKSETVFIDVPQEQKLGTLINSIYEMYSFQEIISNPELLEEYIRALIEALFSMPHYTSLKESTAVDVPTSAVPNKADAFLHGLLLAIKSNESEAVRADQEKIFYTVISTYFNEMAMEIGSPAVAKNLKRGLPIVIKDPSSAEELRELQSKIEDSVLQFETLSAVPNLIFITPGSETSALPFIFLTQASKHIPPGDAADLTTESTPVGGIDFDPNKINLQIRGEGTLAIPLTPEQLQNIQINGLVPVLINITPINNLPLILGINQIDNAPKISLN